MDAHALVRTHPVNQRAAERVIQAVCAVRDDVGLNACEVHGDGVRIDESRHVDPRRCVREQFTPVIVGCEEPVERHETTASRNRGSADIIGVRETESVTLERRLERKRRVVSGLNTTALLDEQVVEICCGRSKSVRR